MKILKSRSAAFRMFRRPFAKSVLFSLASVCLLSSGERGFSQGQTWDAFNDFWYNKGQGWTGSTAPNAWGYFAGNTAGGATSQIGSFLPAGSVYDLTSGGVSGIGNGTGDGNVTLYTDLNGDGITSLGRYTNGVMYVTGAKAAALTTNSFGTKAVVGFVDGGASFDGTSSKIDVGAGASLNPSALTYSAWVKASSFTAAYASIISKAEDGGRVATLLLKSNGKLACYIGGSGGVISYDGSGANTLVKDQWFYLTVTYDSANGLNGYVNGAADGGAGPNGAITTGADDVLIGAHPSFGDRVFSGTIDEARISNVARDANWVWAEWMNMASNSVFNSYSAAAANSGGNFAAWAHKSQITFSGYTKGETLTDFPVLVNIGTNISGFSWSQFANANGNELRFADANGNELPYERDRGAGVWTNDAGIGQVWVKVPQLSSSTVITAYWGNPAATGSAPAYNTDGSVWANGYGGVWHLPDGQNLSANDSTANQNNGTAFQANTVSPSGEIGGAASFSGSSAYINVGTAPTVNPTAITYSAWVNPNLLSVAYASIFSKAENGRVTTMLLKNNGKLACYLSASGGIVNYDGSGANTLTAGNWYYLTMTYDAANGLTGYINGALDGSAPSAGDINVAVDQIWLGGHPSINGRYFNGVIDEARISTVARDANWVWAEWMNMASNNVFNGYGAAVANAGGNFAAWGHKAQISFSGYTKGETLTDFPVLVNIGTNISGFNWSQFANTNGYELRFADANGNELSYERDNRTNAAWITSDGIGQVWVKVPQLSSSTVITAYWGNAAATSTAPAYNSDGSVWSNGYGGVYHLSTPGQILDAGDSTANKNDGQAAATPGGIGYHNTQYLWAEAANIHLITGSPGNAPTSDEGFASILTWTAPAAATYNFSGSFLPGSSGVAGQTNVDVAIVDSLGGTDLVRTVLVQGDTALPYSFSLAMNAGDSVQFQVGDAFQTPAPVGIAATVTRVASPPTLVSAIRSLSKPTEVMVQFSQSLDPASATNISNYSIYGVRVTGAQLSGTDPSVVILTVSPGLNYSSALTVNNVAGSFGLLPIAPNSAIPINLRFYVPNGFGVPTNGAVVSFSGPTLDPHWQSSLVNHDSSLSNYYFTQVFVQSNGVLHAHANNANLDMNFLVYVDDSGGSSVEETLMHLIVKNANFSGTAIAGAAVGVPPNAYDALPPGGNDIRAVPAHYGNGASFPAFVACSDFVADQFPTNRYQQWAVGGSYWLRIRQDVDTNAPGTGGIVSVKAWLGDGSVPEPTAWDLVYKDGAGLDRFGFGAIRAGWGAGAVLDFDVDYFQVTSAALPTVTPTLPPSLIPLIDLNVVISNKNAIVSWPVAAPGNYKLQSSTSLTGAWTDVNTPVVVNGPQNTVTVPVNGQQVFFRLKQ